MNYENQIIQGDCVRVLQALPKACADLVITDPPYLVNYTDRTGRKIADDDKPAAVLDAFTPLYRAMKLNSLCICFYGWTKVDAFFRAWRNAGFQPVGHMSGKRTMPQRRAFFVHRMNRLFCWPKATRKSHCKPWMMCGPGRIPVTAHTPQKRPSAFLHR